MKFIQVKIICASCHCDHEPKQHKNKSMPLTWIKNSTIICQDKTILSVEQNNSCIFKQMFKKKKSSYVGRMFTDDDKIDQYINLEKQMQ